jgi:hypothetical protein
MGIDPSPRIPKKQHKMKQLLFVIIVLTLHISLLSNPYNDRYSFDKDYNTYLDQLEIKDLIPRVSPPFQKRILLFSSDKNVESQKRNDYLSQIRNQLNHTFFPTGKDYIDQRISIDTLNEIPQNYKMELNTIIENDLYRWLNIEQSTHGLLKYFQVISYIEIIKQIAPTASPEDLKEYLNNYFSAVKSLSGRNERLLYIPFYHQVPIEDFDKTTLQLFDGRLEKFIQDVHWMNSSVPLSKAQSLNLDKIINCFSSYNKDQRKLINLDFYAGFFSDYGMDFSSPLKKNEFPHSWVYLFNQRINVLNSDCIRVKALPIEMFKWSFLSLEKNH